MSILISAHTKGEIIEIFRRLLWMVMFPRASAEAVAGMQETLEAIKTGKGNLDIGAKFESNPKTQEVVLTFTLRVGHGH